MKVVIQSHLKIIAKWRRPSPKTIISPPKQTPNDTVILGSDSFVDNIDEDGDLPPDHTVSCDDVTVVQEPVTVAITSTDDLVYFDWTTRQVTVHLTEKKSHTMSYHSTFNWQKSHTMSYHIQLVLSLTHITPLSSNVSNNITQVDRGSTEFTGWVNETRDMINTVESNILMEIRSLKDNNEICIVNLQFKVANMLGRIIDQQKQINTHNREQNYMVLWIPSSRPWTSLMINMSTIHVCQPHPSTSSNQTTNTSRNRWWESRCCSTQLDRS